MSSNCSEFNELLLDLAYDELDSQTSRRLLLHTDTCDACQKAYNNVIGVRTIAGKIDTPPIPSHFDADILALAKKTAASFAADLTADQNDRPSSAPAVPVPGALSVFERIQSFILRPAVIGTGLAAAAVLIAVTSVKNQSPTAMLEAPDGAPFEGAAPVMEREELPALSTDAKNAEPKMKTDKAASEMISTAEEETRAMTSQRVQKAGGGYESMAREKSASKKSEFQKPPAAKKQMENVDGDTPVVSAKIQKNPADLLQQSASDDLASDAGGASENSTPLSAASKTSPARRSKQKGAEYPASNQTPMPPAAPKMSSAGSSVAAEMSADIDAAPAEAEGIASNFQLGLEAYNRGDCKSAISYLEAYVDSPADASGSIAVATHYIARCEKRTGRCGKAVIHYEQLLSEYTTYSKRSDALYEAAQCHLKLGHTDRARTLLDELSLDPDWQTRAKKLLKE